MINCVEPGWLVQRVGGMGCARTLIGETHLPEVNACAKGCARPTREACETREKACAGVV